jgi:hypothetical protein
MGIMRISPITKKLAALLMHPTAVPKPIQEWWWRSVELRDILVECGIANTLLPEDVSTVCKMFSALGSMHSHRDGCNKYFCIALPGHVPKEQSGITAPSVAHWPHESKDLVASINNILQGNKESSSPSKPSNPSPLNATTSPALDDDTTTSPNTRTSPNATTSSNGTTSPLDEPVSEANNNTKNHHQYPKEPPSIDELPIGFADHVRQGYVANDNWLRGKLEKSLFCNNNKCGANRDYD